MVPLRIMMIEMYGGSHNQISRMIISHMYLLLSIFTNNITKSEQWTQLPDETMVINKDQNYFKTPFFREYSEFVMVYIFLICVFVFAKITENWGTQASTFFRDALFFCAK